MFPSRISRDRYRERLRQAADAGVDLVRSWGGGIEEQPLRGEVEAEAR